MRLIDLMHQGRARALSCWEVDDVLVDPGPSSCLTTLLEALGDRRPEALLLTHIHLDHAGATGSLVARWPDLRVYVHTRGAPHMIDPERLMKSARRLYGDEMDALWGEMVPVPEGNIEVLEGGERIRDGRFEVAYTPGHAWHHVSFRHGRTAFVGDTVGARIGDGALTMPATPPPDVDLDAWHESLATIRAWNPERLVVTHFGAHRDVPEQLAEYAIRLEDFSQLARHVDCDTYVAAVRELIVRHDGAERAGSFQHAAPFEQSWAGWQRYWSKRDQQG